jgi:hypothetical protein
LGIEVAKWDSFQFDWSVVASTTWSVVEAEIGYFGRPDQYGRGSAGQWLGGVPYTA